MTTLFLSPLNKHAKVRERGWLTFIKHIIWSTWLLKTSLQRMLFDEQSHRIQKCSQSVPMGQVHPNYFPRIPCHQSCSFQVPDHLNKSFATIDPYLWPIVTPNCTIKCSAQSSGHCPSGSSISGTIMRIDPFVNWAPHEAVVTHWGGGSNAIGLKKADLSAHSTYFYLLGLREPELLHTISIW